MNKLTATLLTSAVVVAAIGVQAISGVHVAGSGAAQASVNWGAPNGNWSATTFGNITSAGSMRVFELTGRLLF